MSRHVSIRPNYKVLILGVIGKVLSFSLAVYGHGLVSEGLLRYSTVFSMLKSF